MDKMKSATSQAEHEKNLGELEKAAFEKVKDRYKYSDDYEVDNLCKTSLADNGCWVQVWTWVPREQFDPDWKEGEG